MIYKIHPDIESYTEIATRMLIFLREAAVAYKGKNVLVVSHAGIIRATLIKLGFGTTQELYHGCIGNAGYAVVESDGVDFFVRETEGITKKVVE